MKAHNAFTACILSIVLTWVPHSGVAQTSQVTPLTAAQIRARLPEIAKLVEQYAGRKFKTPPVIHILEGESLRHAERMANAIMDLQGITSADADYETRYASALVGEIQTQRNPQNSGFYHKTLREVFIYKSGIESICNELGYDAEVCNDKILSTIAHEMVHVLQYQYYEDLIFSVPNPTALLEGHALSVQMRIGQAIGSKFDVRTYLLDKSEYYVRALPAEEAAARIKRVREVYLDGLTLVRPVYMNQGPQATWRFLEDMLTELSSPCEGLLTRFRVPK
jgi:hypothetical protein